MSRFLLLILIALSVNAFAQNTNLAASEQEIKVVEFTKLERRIVELSGLLSLSEQVKTSAQYMITQSTVTAGSNESQNESELIEINHAQHFGIAQSLSKRWAEAEWENRLLTLIATIDEKEQKQIAGSLSQQVIKSARAKEKAAISKQSKAEYLMYMNKLKQRPPADSRLKLVESLDKNSFFSALILSTREKVYSEISSQVQGWKPPNNWKQATKKEVLEFLFYAYRKTSNPELAKIANSYQKPALQSFLMKVQNEL
jgi:hypothetical protein